MLAFGEGSGSGGGNGVGRLINVSQRGGEGAFVAVEGIVVGERFGHPLFLTHWNEGTRERGREREGREREEEGRREEEEAGLGDSEREEEGGRREREVEEEGEGGEGVRDWRGTKCRVQEWKPECRGGKGKELSTEREEEEAGLGDSEREEEGGRREREVEEEGEGEGAAEVKKGERAEEDEILKTVPVEEREVGGFNSRLDEDYGWKA